VGKDARSEVGGGKHGEDRGERPALDGEELLEVAAPRAHGQVPAQRAAAQLAAAGDGELFANLLAGRLARVALGDQRGAGLVDERLDLAHGAPHDRRDRPVGKVVELGEQQRAALLLGQPADVAEELEQVLPPVDLLGEARKRRHAILKWGSRPAGGDRRQAAVAGDRVQPRTELPRGGPAEKCSMGPDERLLKRVLGLVLVAEHVPAVGQQWGVVAPEDRLERPLVAGAGASDEHGVGWPSLLVRSRGGARRKLGDGHGCSPPVRRAAR
jgi:hypothetical protein